MYYSTTNEIKLVNGIGDNLAKLIANDIDFEMYVNLTRRCASQYLNYNQLTYNKIGRILTQQFNNPIIDYVERHKINVAEHLLLAKAHTLYFLGYGISLEAHSEEIKKILKNYKEGYITSGEARENLDIVVMINSRQLKANSKVKYCKKRRTA